MVAQEPRTQSCSSVAHCGATTEKETHKHVENKTGNDKTKKSGSVTELRSIPLRLLISLDRWPMEILRPVGLARPHDAPNESPCTL